VKFDLTRPCGNCPFRSDKPFHLLPGRVREILGGGEGRRWWPAQSFPCHRTIVYGDGEDGDETTIPPTAQQCAGVMWILHKENRPNDAMQLGERFGFWNPATLDPTAPFYNSTEDAIRGQEMIIHNYGSIGTKRLPEGYKCPHCGRYERTRALFRKHVADAHPPKQPVLTHGHRATLSGRAKRVKVALSAPTRYKLTDAQVRALAAVRDGRVFNRFERDRNVFVGPTEIGPILYRKLQSAGMIEDEPAKPAERLGLVHVRKQQLTARGRSVLAAYGG